MAIKTGIQWTDSTINPTLGCDGCELRTLLYRICFAGKITDRFGGHNPGFAVNFEDVDFAPGRMVLAAAFSDLAHTARPEKPWLDGFPRLIFVSDMADALSAAVTFEYLRDEIIANVTSARGVRHVWLWLTKRPRRMAEFSDWLLAQGISWPGNLWAGTSITTQSTATRIDDLLDVGDSDTGRFVSVEPQWEPINLDRWLNELDWVIQGGQSGSVDKVFQLEWADDLRAACHDQGVSYFLKQLGQHATYKGKRLSSPDRHGGDWECWPRKFRVRQIPKSMRARRAGRQSLNTSVTC